MENGQLAFMLVVIFGHICTILHVCNVDECGHRKKSGSMHIVSLSVLASGVEWG